MFNKCALIFACCLAVAIAHPYIGLQQEQEQQQQQQQQAFADYLAPLQYEYEQPRLGLVRAVRSPDGSIDLTYEDSAGRGREASVRYNQNLLSSDDGRYSVDAYGQASRNFDWNRNDYGGGIMGTFRF